MEPNNNNEPESTANQNGADQSVDGQTKNNSINGIVSDVLGAVMNNIDNGKSENNITDLVDNNSTDTESSPLTQMKDMTEFVNSAMSMSDNLQAVVTLSDATASTKLGTDALKSISDLDLSKILSAPLDAAVNAQYNAAKATLKCINEIGVKNGALTVVVFSFYKNGMQAKMSIPLLSLVPINNIRINEMTYDFKLSIKTSSTLNIVNGAEAVLAMNFGNATTPSVSQNKSDKTDSKETGSSQPSGLQNAVITEKTKSESSENTAKLAQSIKYNTSVAPSFGVNFSSKKDSKATQDSKYSVESSVDVSLKVGPDDMPAGISKMLEILNESIEVFNPNGELSVSENNVKLINGVAMVTVNYRDSNGVFAPGKITCKHSSGSSDSVKYLDNGNSRQLIFSTPGLYLIVAEKNQCAVNVE